VVGHVVRVREKRSFYRLSLGNVEERDHLEDLGLDGGNFKEFLKKLGWEAFVQCRDKSQAVAKTMMCLSFPSNVGNILSNEVSVSLSLKYNQQDVTLSRSIYFYKLLYMFQAVPPPIIRSTKLYIQRQVLSNQYCCLLQYWFDNT